jgi:transketolase
VDGHDVEALAAPAEQPREGKPLVVLARTDPCRGLEMLRDRTPKLHYIRFKSVEERQAYQVVLEQLGELSAERKA